MFGTQRTRDLSLHRSNRESWGCPGKSLGLSRPGISHHTYQSVRESQGQPRMSGTQECITILVSPGILGTTQDFWDSADLESLTVPVSPGILGMT